MYRSLSAYRRALQDHSGFCLYSAQNWDSDWVTRSFLLEDADPHQDSLGLPGCQAFCSHLLFRRCSKASDPFLSPCLCGGNFPLPCSLSWLLVAVSTCRRSLLVFWQKPSSSPVLSFCTFPALLLHGLAEHPASATALGASCCNRLGLDLTLHPSHSLSTWRV